MNTDWEIETAMKNSLRSHTDEVAPPPVDVDSLVRRGRRRKGAFAVAGTAALVAVVSVGGLAVSRLGPSTGSGSDVNRDVAHEAAGAPLRVGGAEGPEPIDAPTRVFTTPTQVSIDGRLYPLGNFTFDTGAHVGGEGVAYPDAKSGVPWLLRRDGTKVQLAPDRPAFGTSYAPWLAADAASGLVSWLERDTDAVELVAFDTKTMTEVARHRVDCKTAGGEFGCAVPYAAASGVIFVHGPGGGTIGWRPSDGTWTDLGPAEVSEARGKVVSLFSGKTDIDLTPLGDGWRVLKLTGKHWEEQAVQGDAEALLSFDGNWVSDANGLWVQDWEHPERTLTFRPPGNVTATQFDTDGSLLVVSTNPETGLSRAWDCPVDAACDPLTDPTREEIRLIAWDL